MTLPEDGAVIIGPAWHSCGSYQIFKRQIEALRSVCGRIYFLAVSNGLRSQGRSREFWNKYYSMTTDLSADERGHATIGLIPLLYDGGWRQAVQLWQRSFSYWRAIPARLAKLPLSAHQFLQEHEVKIIICNHYFNLPIALRLREMCEGAVIILETHDVQSRHFFEERRRQPLSGRCFTLEELLTDELAMMRSANILVHTNEEDAAFFKKRLPQHRHFTIFPAVDRNYCDLGSVEHGIGYFDFLIVAAANGPNRLSIKWFFDNIWDDAMNEVFNLKIVGDIDELIREKNPNLYERYHSCFLGRVTEIGPYYRSAGTVLLPTCAGQGISMKTIEALSFGKPIIATPLAFRGFERHLPKSLSHQVVDSPTSFREKLLAAAGRTPSQVDRESVSLYEKLFSPERRLRKYASLLRDARKNIRARKPATVNKLQCSQLPKGD